VISTHTKRLRLGQAHRERRPQPPIAYSQFMATDDLPLALTLGSTEGYISSGSLVAAHTAESNHAESSVSVAVADSGVYEY